MRHLGFYQVPGATCDVWLVGRGEVVQDLAEDFTIEDWGYYDGGRIRIFVRDGAPAWIQEHEKQHFIDDISGAGVLMENAVKVTEMDEVLIRIRSPWFHLCVCHPVT